MSYRYRSSTASGLSPVIILILINVILYVAVSVRRDLIALLGFFPPAFPEEPWTILTSMFIHAPFPSLGHILGNMITLYFFGGFLVDLVGNRNFFIVYFIGGIVGNLFYFFLFPAGIAIGASGAIFALGGALTVLRPSVRMFVFPIPVPIPLWVAVIGGFLILSFIPGVAWQAHLGGLIVGLVAGYIFRRRRHYY